MRQSVETTNGLERKVTVSVPAGNLSEAFDARLRSTATDLKLPGFRPGKVPLKVVRQRFGSKLLAEVGSALVQKTFEDAMQAEALSPAGSATIDIITMADGKDLEYTATFEIFPEFELVPFDTLVVRVPKTAIEEADIDRTVEHLREQRMEWLAVERPAQLGDRVLLDQSVEAAGETLSKWVQRAFVLEDADDDRTKTLVGMSAGETRAFPMTVPVAEQPPSDLASQDPANDQDEGDDHGPAEDRVASADADQRQEAEEEQAPAPEAEVAAPEAVPPSEAGDEPKTRQAIATVTLHRVEEPQLPELDDAFFDWFEVAQEGDRMAAFRAAVRTRMDVELDAAMRRAKRREVLATLAAAHEFALPNVLVEGELAAAKQRIAAVFGIFPQAMEGALRENAEDEVRQVLVVRAIARERSLSADAARVADRIDEMASGYEQPTEVRRYLYGDEDRLREIEFDVLREQVAEMVLEAATVQTVEMPYTDVVANAPLPPAPVEDAPESAAESTEADAEAEPSAREREGPAPRKKEPSAGEREGPRLACETPPRKKEPSPAEEASDAKDATAPTAGRKIAGRLRRLFRGSRNA